ncbi:unnamed protein product [Trichobilharzia szidati]|nr:unnamed protein product [Trichobilharzia szidati]
MNYLVLLKITCILSINWVYGVEENQSNALNRSSLSNTTLTTLESNSSATNNNSAPSTTAGLPLKSGISTSSPTPVTSNVSSTVHSTSTKAVTTKNYDFVDHDTEEDELNKTKLTGNPMDIHDTIDVPQIGDSPKESDKNDMINNRYSRKELFPQKTGDRNRPLESEDSFVEGQYFSHVSTSYVLIICCIVIVLLLCIWKPLCHIVYGIYTGYCPHTRSGTTGISSSTSSKVAYHPLSSEYA